MDIRVDNMQQVNATTQTQQAQQSGEDFKFTLMSSIEEAGLSNCLFLNFFDTIFRRFPIDRFDSAAGRDKKIALADKRTE